jgi:DNA polymerase/3'-5' exonuclease PolX
MSCTIPANQPIYQALLDKGASYPADKWRASAYRKAAETVSKYEANIYEEFAKYNGFAGYKPMAIGNSTENFIRDFIKAESEKPKTPAAAEPTTGGTKCTVPANEPIYQALLDKAASYPADKVYQARAYRDAAEKLRTHTTDLFSIKDRNYELLDHLDDYWGPHVAEFIQNYIVANHFVHSKRLSAHEPIYNEFLSKAADAKRAGLSWKAKAWTTSAEKLAAADIDLVANYETDEYNQVLHTFGPKAQEVINGYCKTASAVRGRYNTTPANDSECVVPNNYSLYRALMHRARNASNKYAAEHYMNAAQNVLYSPRSISLAWAFGKGEEVIRNLKVSPSIAAYIKHYLTETRCQKEFKYPTTDDEKAEEALKIYCIKNGYTLTNAVFEEVVFKEYKKWRPSASKWDLEEFDYKAQKYIPRPVAKIATIWAERYAAALKPLIVANKYKQGVINYCKRNNIVYQPLMLERLNAWREANKDKLVYTFPICGCTPECAGGQMNTWPIGVPAVINRWFASLPKTVSL